MKFLYAAVFSACVVAGLAYTNCQEHREKELKSNTKVKLIPKCDENGDYEALQCFDGSPFCMCWRPDGTHVVEPSMKIKTCACHNHRDKELQKANKGMVGNFIPECEESGHYKSKQCHGSIGYCWCADKEGNQIGEKVRGELKC